jgi:hypothetical protein
MNYLEKALEIRARVAEEKALAQADENLQDTPDDLEVSKLNEALPLLGQFDGFSIFDGHTHLKLRNKIEREFCVKLETGPSEKAYLIEGFPVVVVRYMHRSRCYLLTLSNPVGEPISSGKFKSIYHMMMAVADMLGRL